MARTRMIKPEFWSDEKLAALSLQARLIYIGLWNLSDDYGIVKGHPSWLKNSVLPYDDVSPSQFESWLAELERIRRIIPFISDGEKFYSISNFQKHQTINRPSQTRNPDPPAFILEDSLSAHGALTDETETEREREIKTTTAACDEKNRLPPEENVAQEKHENPPAHNAGRHQPKPVARVSSPVRKRIDFDYETGHFQHVLPELVEKWQEAYPAVDVLSELHRMEAWALANPVNRKSNWQRFIVNWLTKSQDRARSGGSGPGPPAMEGSLERWIKMPSVNS
jgi:hypothetical protein